MNLKALHDALERNAIFEARFAAGQPVDFGAYRNSHFAIYDAAQACRGELRAMFSPTAAAPTVIAEAVAFARGAHDRAKMGEVSL